MSDLTEAAQRLLETRQLFRKRGRPSTSSILRRARVRYIPPKPVFVSAVEGNDVLLVVNEDAEAAQLEAERVSRVCTNFTIYCVRRAEVRGLYGYLRVQSPAREVQVMRNGRFMSVRTFFS